jgi:endo-alpha-1,4-polygalactosaminidase (GH114 family)
MTDKKQYLGDGVYADWVDEYRFVLTTENGVSVQNTIYLDCETMEALLKYVEKQYELLNGDHRN